MNTFTDEMNVVSSCFRRSMRRWRERGDIFVRLKPCLDHESKANLCSHEHDDGCYGEGLENVWY